MGRLPLMVTRGTHSEGNTPLEVVGSVPSEMYCKHASRE